MTIIPMVLDGQHVAQHVQCSIDEYWLLPLPAKQLLESFGTPLRLLDETTVGCELDLAHWAEIAPLLKGAAA